MSDLKKLQKETIIVNGYAYPFIRNDVLEEWMQDLTFLLTFSYGITPDGDLIDLNDEELIRVSLENGVKPLMVVAPFNEAGEFSAELAHAVLINPEARERLLNNILATLQNKGLYGVDFDFEFMYGADRDFYTSFIEEAAVKLNREGYLVSIAIAPKTSAEQKGILYEAHDYVGLGQAANLILLMTYDWGYVYGPPMAVSPLDKVQEVLDYAVTAIPPEKILMGIPNYAYDWTLPYIEGEGRAEKVTHIEAAERAARYGAEIQFDEAAQVPYYYYVDELGNTHVVWFEDARSIRAKLELVSEYGLAGVGVWNVMDPFPIFSEALHSMYNVLKIR
ncbi:MAG: glycosyl hydrolase family 18 protein [Clostridiales bacterium]|nr:glycosyl hydrolase family 18 protein [Clostridiales bacterium]